MADRIMANAVMSVLQEVFMKAKDGDVYMKAAQMTAINLLEEGFRELKKCSAKAEQEIKESTNIGL